ncbi:MAG: nitroreductase [Dactylosporangium sp.]|nr:nitroreductase [Dactylosporangium sp.]
MAMIQFTERGPARHAHPTTRALAKAAVAASRAPSIFNSQPWRWRIADVAELRADWQRQLATVDPDGRLLTISCGAALHYARTALAGTGVLADVTRLPDATDPDLIARIRVVGDAAPAPAAVRLQLAMALRHTDRRPFADVDVPTGVLERLRDAAEAQGAHLHLLRPDEVITLAVAAARASETEFADPRYLAELSAWTGRPVHAPDGVPASTAPQYATRPVPLRDLDPGAPLDMTTPELVDRHACYAVLFTDSDTPADWLAAGEALSAVLLTASAERLAASPISDVVEVPATRLLLRDMLSRIGYPMVALRVGVPEGGAAAAAGRRAAADIIDVNAVPPA